MTIISRAAGLRAAILVAAALASATLSAQSLRFGLAEDPDVLDPTLARTFVGRIVFAALCDKLFDIDEKLAHRAAARDRLRMVGRQQGADDQDAPRRHLPRRREARRRGGEVQHRAAQDDGRLQPPRRAGAGDKRRRRRSDDGAAQPLGAVLAAAGALADRAGMMVSPKAAQAAGDKFGAKPVCSGPFKFVERVAQDRIVLERYPDYWNKGQVHFDKVDLHADRRRDGAPGQPAARASSTSSSAWRRPTSRR